MGALTVVLLALVLCITNTVCFVFGAKVGQSVVRGEKVELPSVNPLKAIREQEAKKEAKAEQERVNTILDNIEVYDGTDRGQKDVPKKR